MKKARFLKATVGGQIALRTLEGREMLVAPIIALVEGVIQASNSDAPELVLAEEFGKLPQSWNGRFVMYDHPQTNGEKVSANQPEIVDRLRLGTVFNARVEQKKLKMDAWFDTTKVQALGEAAVKLVDAVRRGETVEVSVGVFTTAEESSGTHNGVPYRAIWREIMPDHLALLPEGTVGACSIQMGCGTRAASQGGKVVKSKWNEARRLLLQRFIAAQEGEGEAEASDRDIRTALESALFAEEPGFMGVVDVFAETELVVYAVAPEGESKFMRRGYKKADDGSVTLSGGPEEVKQVTKYEAAAAALVAAACGCGAAGAVQPNPTQEAVMADKAKKDRVAALVVKLAAKSPELFKVGDALLLEEWPDERLAALEAHATAVVTPAPVVVIPPVVPPVVTAPVAETPKQLTEEEYLKTAPESVRTVLAEHKAAAERKKTELVTKLAAAQKAYTEPELKALSVEALEKLVQIAVKAPADFGPLGPRVAAESEGVPPPPSMRERVLAARKQGA